MNKQNPPLFYRYDVAKILNCTPLTISNREKSKTYPEPTRNSSNYRIYTIEDILELQYITYKRTYLSPIVAFLWDEGYTDVREVETMVNAAFEAWRNSKAQVEKVVSS